jgi:hypothetical protein
VLIYFVAYLACAICLLQRKRNLSREKKNNGRKSSNAQLSVFFIFIHYRVDRFRNYPPLNIMTEVRLLVFLCIFLAELCLLAAAITTKSTSPIRKLATIIITIVAYFHFQMAQALTISNFHNGMLAIHSSGVVLNAANLLLINKYESNFWGAAAIVVNRRCIGTRLQAKNIPENPRYYQGQTPRKSSFLLRQAAIFLWQYLVLDIFFYFDSQQPLEERERQYGNGQEFRFDLSSETLIFRVLITQITWYLGARLVVDSCYRLFSILAVGTGISSPQTWPPVFGRMASSYTLRNFWG